MKNGRLLKITIYILNFLLFAFFCYWFFANDSMLLFPTVFSLFNIIIICSLVNKLAQPLEEIWHINREDEIERYFFPETPDRSYYIKIIIISSIFFILISVILMVSVKIRYPGSSLNSALYNHFSSISEVEKYVFLSINWYTNIHENFADYKNIFPLYLILIYPFAATEYVYILQIIINIVLSVLSCVFLFNVALFDYEEDTAFKASIFLIMLPFSFFLVTPLPLALLLFVSLIYIYFVRRHEWLYSAVAGYFVGLIHPIALVLMVFGFVEFISYLREEMHDVFQENTINIDKSALFYISKKGNFKYFLPFIIRGLSIFSIFVSYLFFIYLNKNIYVNEANIFLTIKEFSQLDGPYFFSNAFYIIKDFEDALRNMLKSAFSIYIPTILSMVVILLMLFNNHNKLRASYFLYSLVFYMILFSNEAVLSQTKYLAVFFPLTFILALLSEERLFFIISAALSTIALIIYYILYIIGFTIM